MSLIKDGLSNLQTFLQDHHLSFSNGILILLTVGGEQIFQASVFHCPCTQPRAAVYGLMFLIIPAILLVIIGIAVSNLTWRVLHGCCNRSTEGKNVSQTDKSRRENSATEGSIEREQGQNPGGAVKNGQGHAPVEGEQEQKPGKQTERAENEPQLVRSHGFRRACVNLCMVLSRSLIVPIAWLCLSFLDGSYYACIRTEKPCEKDSKDYKKWKEESQIISWCLLLSVAVISSIVIGITRCMDSVTYSEYRYISTYREAEECQIDCHLKEKSKESSKQKIKVFMQKERPKEDWDAIALAPDLSGSSLSPLDKWYEIQPPEEKEIEADQ